jgi:hypothetical protein
MLRLVLNQSRLGVGIPATAAYYWKPEHVLGQWYDRKKTRVEGYLNDLTETTHSGAALLPINRLADEEAERRRQEAVERLQEERRTKRAAFIGQKAEEYARLLKLQAFDEDLAPSRRPRCWRHCSQKKGNTKNG